MDFVNNLFNGLGYVEGITIINVEGEILFSAKFNNKLYSKVQNYEVIGEKFLDVYENLDETTSSLYTAMRTGVPVYADNQTLISHGLDPIKIVSLSIPIKSGRRIVGAIDISVSVTDDEGVDPLEAADENMEILDEMLSEFNKVYKLDTGRDTARYRIEDIHTCDRTMLNLRKSLGKLAKTDLPVLICGETGTGKELVAQAIHNASSRADKPFIAQNCASIPANLLESLLFGTSKGAFTGALDNVGLLELADGGTLFLDEINSMPIEMQSKLLRVIQTGTFRRLGDKVEKKVNVRYLSSSNEELDALQNEGKLRKDLFYRLAVLTVNIPPLRERKKDIPLLANLFINRYSNMLGKNIHKVSVDLYDKLMKFPWYGNVRELENVIAFGVSMADMEEEVLSSRHVEERLKSFDIKNEEPEEKIEEAYTLSDGSFADRMNNYEKIIISRALEKAGGNITKAAAALDIPRQTLSRKIRDLGLR